MVRHRQPPSIEGLKSYQPSKDFGKYPQVDQMKFVKIGKDPASMSVDELTATHDYLQDYPDSPEFQALHQEANRRFGAK